MRTSSYNVLNERPRFVGHRTRFRNVLANRHQFGYSDAMVQNLTPPYPLDRYHRPWLDRDALRAAARRARRPNFAKPKTNLMPRD